MAAIKATRDFYLWGTAMMYLFAFGSLYVQIPGLYGKQGILPAHLVVQKEPKTVVEFLDNQPTLLRLLPYIGLDAQTGLDLLCLVGILVSMIMLISLPQRDMFGFAILWYLYFSVYQVGQTFLWFQWDILLLEAGFLTILVAPLNFKLWKGSLISYGPHDNITMWLVRWLLFRLMFASGVVKLTSGCPTWWGLTALNYHYETQCISTPIAWYAHQLPEWFQKLSVVTTYVIEIAVPFLFFAPVRFLRLFAAGTQVFLMIAIMITGNYNFFNLLTMVLCIPLLDDKFFGKKSKAAAGFLESFVPFACDLNLDKDFFLELPIFGRVWKLIKILLIFGTFAALAFYTGKYFDIRMNKDFTISTNIVFSKTEFQQWLQAVVPVTIWLGVISLTWEIMKAIARSLTDESNVIQKFISVFKCLIFAVIACGMFAISLVPHTAIEHESRQLIPRTVTRWHDKTDEFQITSSYGLFRSMTGVGGRPEVIIEGSNQRHEGWKEYEFLYKPGNVSRIPPIVAPHQPRLDWQMWFAALGSYQHNPWFLNLVYRLLSGQPEVLELIQHNPFPQKPPKFIRATLYHYYFTKLGSNKVPVNWWRREHVKEYLPPISMEESSFIDYLKQYKLLQDENEDSQEQPANYLTQFLQFIRSLIGQMEGFNFVMSLFTAVMLVVIPISMSGR